jgi:ABC-type polysaccharide/polyol phosphate transport system ATPase subunit
LGTPDVSFDIQKGDVVGIIGRNGAGKSTLLKILSRITEPTTGHIDLYGRGAACSRSHRLPSGADGRENIFLNGAILGMKRREIDKQFDAIVDFAGIEKFRTRRSSGTPRACMCVWRSPWPPSEPRDLNRGRSARRR